MRFAHRFGPHCRRLAALALLPVLALLTTRDLESGQKPNAALLRPGDHVSIIGNTLAERLQHDGWLETYLHSRFPKHDLVFRNLGYAADELTVRLRSMDFGTPDQWLAGKAPIPQPNKLNPNAPVRQNRFELTGVKSNVIFAFFGYNESFAGEAGLPKFKKDLENFIKHTRSQKYNGVSPPRLVLFSPIAYEDLKDPNLPPPGPINKRLEMYTAAMAEVAMANEVPFVNLYEASKELYAKSPQPLTINGVHLNEHGNQKIAEAIDRALFPHPPARERTTEWLEKLRQAVVDRNFHWFHRYRTTDGYSTYGDRAFLRFVGGQTNYEVVQRELEILDIMTANRDKKIWAVARSGGASSPEVDDSNTPDYIPVQTNKPGPLPGGKHVFLDGEEAIKLMTVGKNMKVSLFASEKQFPELINPVQMAFDTKGRLWVAVWPTYPHWKPKEKMNDALLIFEDTDGDGRADRCKEFAGNLHNPTGFEFWNGGVLVSQAPDIVFLKDTDGDDKADVRVRVLSGIDSADTHHTANSFTFDPGGALYFQEGTFHHTQIETPWGPPVRSANAGVFRYEPRNHKLDLYVNFGFANPHGHVFDRWGQDIVVDGTGANPYHGTLFSGQTADFRQRHGRPPQVYQQKTRPCPGLEILSSRHFPDEMQGNLLVPNVIGFLGILQYKLKDKGASFEGVEVEPILSSKDPNFRPADVEIGPDGAIWFVDWQNPIIGHMQHNLRDPSRDRKHGRIYRVPYEGRPLSQSPKIHGAAVAELLELLKHPEDRVRYRTRIELGGRDTKEVMAALQKWIPTLDRTDKEYEHHLMEALWLHQNHNVVNEGLLRRMLRSPEFRARAAATRVLCYWRDRVAEPLKLLQAQINDPHPRVRLEAIRALSFFEGEEPVAVAMEMLAHPDDPYLRYTFNETLNTLERRAGAGKINRSNFAATLLGMLQQGKIDAKRQAAVIETITRHGSAKELQAIFEQAVRDAGYSAQLRRNIFEWLADAAITRRVQPKVNPATAARLFHQPAGEPELQAAAIRLAAAWNVKEGAAELLKIARNSQTPQGPRFAAIDGLAVFKEAKVLRELADAPHALPVRFRAAAALAQIDLKEGAKAAAAALAAAKDGDDPAPLVEAFLVRKGGSETLAAALHKQRISADTAKGILRAMYLAGRSDAQLADVVSKLAGPGAAPRAPTPDEIKQIAAAVLAKGDAARGERVFRRLDLGCVKCHAINKSGGDIGPDLGPIGSTSPVDYIITSILDPNQAIKEEYLTKVIATTSGQFYTGVVVERTKNQVVLKDATGKLVRIPTADIDTEANGKSLMPEGITRILTKGEMIDLIRFVSELGKPGPYAIPTTPTIRTWKRLVKVPEALREGVPNRDVIRDTVLRAGSEAWEAVYTKVNGELPLEELRASAAKERSKVVWLQGTVQVVQGGPVEVHVASKAPSSFWIDEEGFEKQDRAVINLGPGRHRITVRVELGAEGAPALRVTLGQPANSRAHFEVVHAERE